MKNKDYTILDNSHSQECYKCLGTGLSDNKPCETCDGTGLWIENHYILIDEKNKIAFDSDTGGN